MADTLRTYQLPNSHLPGSPLLSKYICKEPSVMAAILASVFEKPPNDYYCGDTCLINGSRCDILYQSRSNVPIMVQIQKKVTQSWLRNILVQCCQVIGNENTRPIIVIFSLEPLPSDVKVTCRPSSSYTYDMDMPLFAQKIKLFCPELVNHYLKTNNSNSLTIPPVVALSSFFSSQHPSAQTSSNLSNHPFYEELYHHAAQFCHRLTIDLEPFQHNTTTNTATSSTATKSYLRQSTSKMSITSTNNVSNKRAILSEKSQSKRPRSSSQESNSTSPRTSSATEVISPSASPSPTTVIHSNPSSNDKNQYQMPLVSMKQHDPDVILDFCQEQIELNKDWGQIYDEGYGKYFVYKNKESLRRSVVPHLRGDKSPIITKTSEHNMDEIMKYCAFHLNNGRSWDVIFDMGKGIKFAYQNSALLRNAYRTNFEIFNAKYQ